jgi:CO dehydrogenase maturation factor
MGVDVMLAVVEPGRRSVETAHRIQGMASSLGIRQFRVVLNKAGSPKDREWVLEEFGGGALIGVIPWDRRIAEADRLGQSLVDLGEDDLVAPFRALAASLSKEVR